MLENYHFKKKGKKYFKSSISITFITFKYDHYTSFIQWPLSNHSLITKKIEWEMKYNEKNIQFKVIEDVLWLFDKSSNNNPRNKIPYIVSVFTTASILMYLLYFVRNSCSRMVLTRNNSYLAIFIFQGKKTIVAFLCNDHSSLRKFHLMYDASHF